MEYITDLLALVVFVGVMIWIMVRSKRSYRIQEEARSSQQEMMEPFFESVRLAREATEIARNQLKISQELLEEIKALREEMRE